MKEGIVFEGDDRLLKIKEMSKNNTSCAIDLVGKSKGPMLSKASQIWREHVLEIFRCNEGRSWRITALGSFLYASIVFYFASRLGRT